MAAHNIMYKTLGFKWLFELSAPHQLLQRQTGKSPAIPNVLYMYPLAVSVERPHYSKSQIKNLDKDNF